jgi:hypothetical protein
MSKDENKSGSDFISCPSGRNFVWPRETILQRWLEY